LLVFSVSKSISNNIFLLPMNLLTNKNYRRKIHRQSNSIGDFVGKLITNGMIVKIPMKNYVVNIKIVVAWEQKMLLKLYRSNLNSELDDQTKYFILWLVSKYKFQSWTTQFKGKMERRKHNVSQQEKEDMALFSMEDG